MCSSDLVKPVVLPGEIMSVLVLKEGKEFGQGVGYLDDGTMVVVDQARDHIGDKVSVGPYSIVGPEVELDDGVELMSHVVVDGRTSIGANTRIFPFASIGLPPQDLKYNGEPSRLTIGCDNIIREHVTMNPGTEGGGMETNIGNNCLFMIGAHVAHDCQIGDHVILVNNATLAGHVTIQEWAIIGGLAAVHQFVRIGKHAMVGGKTGVAEDVIPYGSVIGNRARLSGLNIIGLKRRDFSRDDIHNLRKAYRSEERRVGKECRSRWSPYH